MNSTNNVTAELTKKCSVNDNNKKTKVTLENTTKAANLSFLKIFI